MNRVILEFKENLQVVQSQKMMFVTKTCSKMVLRDKFGELFLLLTSVNKNMGMCLESIVFFFGRQYLFSRSKSSFTKSGFYKVRDIALILGSTALN